MEFNSTSGFMLQTMLYLVNHNATTLMNSIYEEKVEPLSNPNEVRCFGVYGCFAVNGPWMVENRPQAHPFSPSIIDVKFPTFTNKNRNTPKVIDINDPETIYRVGINPKGHIYVIAHGFLESGDRPWVKALMNALLDYENEATVVIVDWRGGSSPPYYQAVANIRVIGAITAHIIYSIYEEIGLKNLDTFHLIGHSLGAHLCGYCGYNLQRDFGLTVDRITALDPAEPFFANTDTIVRLDQNDARYVDVIHSDIAYFVKGGFGLKQKIGHVDFYPNGGREQPGCDAKSIQIGCNHVRSIKLFTESIHSKCPFKSITCDSYEAFKKGKCSRCDRDKNFCIKFGFHSRSSYKSIFLKGHYDSGPVATYLLTNDKEPFCAAHYKVTVKVSDSEESRRHGGEIGILYMKLKNGFNETKQIQFNPIPIFFQPGSNHTFLTIGEDMSDIETVFVEYKFKQTFNPLTWRVFSPRVHIEFMVVESMEHNTFTKVCPHHSLAVGEDKGVLFRQDVCHYKKP